jgi:hypothetical protein
LHWDFSPGLTFADQVHRRFGSTVHFSSSPSSKEFFLVVFSLRPRSPSMKNLLVWFYNAVWVEIDLVIVCFNKVIIVFVSQ